MGEHPNPPARDHDRNNPVALVTHCVNELSGVPVRTGTNGVGMEAMSVIVVSMDNVNLASTAYGTTAPAPAVGDPLQYDAVIQRLCNEYCARFP